MGDKKENARSVSVGWIFWAFVWGAVGYFVYGSMEGAIGLALFSALAGLTIGLGFIPVVGVGLTYLATNFIKSWMLQYIAMSWAISIIFLLTLLGSAFTTLIAVVILFAASN